MPITKGFRQLVDEANAQITTYSVEQVRARLDDPTVQIVDIRDVRELEREGTVPGCINAPRGMLEFWVDPASPYYKPVFGDEGREYILFCGAGWRSALAAKALKDMGMTNVAHIDGGWAGSQRQQILFALLYGPTDWTTVAAIVALAALTHSEPDLTVRAQIRRDVEQAFAWMRGQVPTEGFCCFAYPLGCAWLTLDGLSEAQRADVAAWTKKLYDEVGASTVYVCELEAKKFDQAEEMAKAQGAQRAIAAANLALSVGSAPSLPPHAVATDAYCIMSSL